MVFNPHKFGNDVMAIRLELGLTLPKLAHLANMDKSLLMTYMNGQESNMKMQNFLRLCNALDLDPRYYFELEL